MPIPISQAGARELAPQFDEALGLVSNEFEGLDLHRQYRNAFARLLKPDPLHRVFMMGTDQRDMFVPELRKTIRTCVPVDGHILDFGAGDGQTFGLVAESVPAGTRVSIEDPNPEYLASYTTFLKTQAHLHSGITIAAGFDEIDSASVELNLPPDGSVDLALALHMVYFVKDLTSSLKRMLRFLKPGGVLFLVVTDETVGYTGVVLDSLVKRGGGTPANTRHLSVISERRRLFGSPTEAGGAITDVLHAAGLPIEVEVQYQPSRLYGHTIADLIALCAISVLSGVDGLAKFQAAAALLRDAPDAVDLRIEDDGPRMGMWSVTQPQWVSTFHRAR